MFIHNLISLEWTSRQPRLYMSNTRDVILTKREHRRGILQKNKNKAKTFTVSENPLRPTCFLKKEKDKLSYRHVSVYKHWRQTRTSVYWCWPDRRWYEGTSTKTKTLTNVPSLRDRRDFQASCAAVPESDLTGARTPAQFQFVSSWISSGFREERQRRLKPQISVPFFFLEVYTEDLWASTTTSLTAHNLNIFPSII